MAVPLAAVGLAALVVGTAGCGSSVDPAITSTPTPSRTADDPGAAAWVRVAREQVAAACDLDPALLAAMEPQLLTTPYVIVRYGRLCWSGGYPGGTTTPYNVFSVTKTFGAILFGMVARRSSYLDDTNPVSDWLAPDELGDINPSATLAHILAMTSTKTDLRPGMKGDWSYDSGGDREINALVGIMNRAIAAEPAAFAGIANVKELAEKALFAPLGMTQSSWPGENIGSTLVTSVEDMARLGLLLLRKGEWNGQQLLDASYVYRMTHPAFEDTNTGYGYLTQLNAALGWAYSSGTPDQECSPYTTWPVYPHAPFYEASDENGGSPFGSAPEDIGVFWAAGALGQKLSVHRGLDLVIAVRDDVIDVTGIDVMAGQGLFEGHRRVWRLMRPALVALDPVYAGDEDGFCTAYRQSAYAPALLSPWSADDSK